MAERTDVPAKPAGQTGTPDRPKRTRGATPKPSTADSSTLAAADASTRRVPRDVPVDADGNPVVVTRSGKSLVLQARIGAGLGILGLLLAGVFFFQGQSLRAAEATRQEVAQVGDEIALQVTTFQGATIDEWVEQTRTRATGDYADELGQLFDDAFRTAMAENQMTSEGVITNSFVQDISGDDATVFALLRQTYDSTPQPSPITDDLRMEIRLTRLGGQWLASEVAVLGPSAVTPLAGADAPETTPQQDGS